MVQLSAMIASRLGQLVRAPVPRLRLLVAVAVPRVSPPYNAPISGALFVSEIVLGSLAMDTFGPLVVASVISDATIHRFLGYGPVFNVPHVQFASNWSWVLYRAGRAVGAPGAAVSRLDRFYEGPFRATRAAALLATCAWRSLCRCHFHLLSAGMG